MKQKRQLYKIIAAAVLFAVAFMLPVSGCWRLAVWSAAYLIVGLPMCCGRRLWESPTGRFLTRIF